MGRIMNEIEGVSVWRQWDGKCPDCGATDFYEGPSGGMSVNIMCAKCSSWFNHMGPFGIERIRWSVPEGCLAVADVGIPIGLINKTVGLFHGIINFFSVGG
jgi:hypothetical protein